MVIPRQQFVNPVDLVICNTAENIYEPSLRINAVKFGSLNQCEGNGHGFTAPRILSFLALGASTTYAPVAFAGLDFTAHLSIPSGQHEKRFSEYLKDHTGELVEIMVTKRTVLSAGGDEILSKCASEDSGMKGIFPLLSVIDQSAGKVTCGSDWVEFKLGSEVNVYDSTAPAYTLETFVGCFRVIPTSTYVPLADEQITDPAEVRNVYILEAQPV